MLSNFNGAQLSYLWALKLLHTLYAGGVTRFVTSPGFRNSPLLLALLDLQKDHNEVQVFSHIDERGAGFFALGLAKASRAPAAVLCTSGTAAANFFPAVLEAKFGRVPLVIITADRPQELMGIGANQTMDQQNLFGANVSAFASFAAPTSDPTQWQHMEYTVGKTLAAALEQPVHLNCAFREPFLLSSQEKAPLTLVKNTGHRFAKETKAIEISKLALAWGQEKRVLVLVGPGEWTAQEKIAFVKLSQLQNTLLLCESSSGLDRSETILRRCENFKSVSAEATLLVRFGPPLTSRTFEMLENSHTGPYWVFDRAARNPSLRPAEYFTEDCLLQLSSAIVSSSGDQQWRQDWVKAESLVEQKIQLCLKHENALTEWHISRILSQKLTLQSNLFLGNSMPIRDFNSVAEPNGATIYCNRGLSGIDGLVSTALGVAQASQGPSYALLGDLSTLHDITALSLAHRLSPQVSLQIWVINNLGGEIFRVVRTNTWPELEKWFTTPQNLDFAALSKGFNLPYQLITTQAQLNALSFGTGIQIIELRVDPAANQTIRKCL